MKAKSDCIACMFRQALTTCRLLADDPDLEVRVLQRLGAWLNHADMNDTPAALSQPAYEIIAELTGVRDPYAAAKKESNRVALAVLPRLKPLVDNAPDPLDAALHLAAAGNIIDLGIGHTFDIEKDVEAMLHQPFAIHDLAAFKRELQPGRRLLYLGDNAGEIVFDTLLVRELQKTGVNITFTVKSGPIINDATMQDAEEAGMTSLVRVIDTGAADIGVHWAHVSNDFRQAFESADLVISKGHGNFETCNNRPENIYFLLKVKCELVAGAIGARLGDIVFKHKPAAHA